MWRAIQQLPEDLYDEAVASKPENVPEELLFHNRYRGEIFRSLTEYEQRKLPGGPDGGGWLRGLWGSQRSAEWRRTR